MKQLNAGRWVCHKNKQRKQTKQEQEDQSKYMGVWDQQVQANLTSVCVYPEASLSFTLLHLTVSCLLECKFSHYSIRHNITAFPGTTWLRVDWYEKAPFKELASISHGCISIFNLEFQTRDTERCAVAGVEGDIMVTGCMRAQRETKRWKMANDPSPCGKTHSSSCCCWPQQNSWEEADMSHMNTVGHWF